MKAPLESVLAAKLAAQLERQELFLKMGLVIDDDGRIVRASSQQDRGASSGRGVACEEEIRNFGPHTTEAGCVPASPRA